jgi:hypothetical protein
MEEKFRSGYRELERRMKALAESDGEFPLLKKINGAIMIFKSLEEV